MRISADYSIKSSTNATRYAMRPTYAPKPQPSQPAAAYGCPLDLEGSFASPELMVPVSRADPDKAVGKEMSGIIGGPTCSLYNFNISSGHAGQQCSIVWLFPEKKYKDNSTFFVTQPDEDPVMEFWHVRQPARDGMTW